MCVCEQRITGLSLAWGQTVEEDILRAAHRHLFDLVLCERVC